MPSAAVVEEKDVREQYLAWKRLVPYLYDAFINHHLTWPSLSCRWGPLIHSTANRHRQRLYLSEQTDGSEPNKLVVVTADIARPRVSTAEAVSTWSEQARSPHISAPYKTLVHPGEVNKLLDVPQHPSIVVTHSDSPDVYVWNFDAQHDRASDLASGGANCRRPSAANVVLKGHTDNAEFALGVSSAAPFVASGGKDTNVLVWGLEDVEGGLAAGPATVGGRSTVLEPRVKLVGHNETVEDVCFLPGSENELASVADDFMLLLWDTRAGGLASRVPRAHGERDIHCVDWSALRPQQLATGAQDGGVRVWDRRNLGGPLYVFNHHANAVMNLEWNPHKEGLLATGADDGLVCVWNLDARSPEPDAPASKKQKVPAPHQLLFQHAGHQSPVVDFCWNPDDPWTMLSASVDVQSSGGGTLQLWRVSDLIWRSEEEIMAELEPFKDYIVTGDESKLPGASGAVKKEDAKGGGDGQDAADVAMAENEKDPVTKSGEDMAMDESPKS
jgi:histone-binding protein RBBP4